MGKRKKWRPSEIQLIKDSYGVVPLADIASRLGRTISSVSHKIAKLGLDDPRQWTPFEDRILIANYEYNPDVWGLLPGRSRAAVTQRAAKVFNLSRKCGNYSINWRFFDAINHDSAYVLGFIAADGCIEPGLNRLSISQAATEADILYSIREAMGSSNPICFKNARNEAAIYIHNRHIVDILESLGIGSNKTLRGTFPEMEPEFEPDFIRGLFDGDGSIYIPSDNRSGRIQFLGSHNMLTQLRFRLIGVGCSSRPEVRKRQVNTHILSYSSNDDLLRLYNYMYKYPGIMIQHKAQTFGLVVRSILDKVPSPEAEALGEFTQLKSGKPLRGQS